MPGPAAFFAFDVETTGLDAAKHEIISIAMMLTDIEFTELKRECIYAFPKRIEDASPEALAINKYDHGVWTERGAVTQEEMLQGIRRFIKGFFRLRQVAYNHRFDERFLKALFEVYAADDPRAYNDGFSFHALDALALGIFTDITLQGKFRKGYGLNALAECYGVTNASAHDAMADVECMVATLKAMMQSIRHAANVKPPVIEVYSGIMKVLDPDKDVWIFQRGKHTGKLTHLVWEEDRQYVVYVAGFNDLSVAQKDHLKKLMGQV